MFEEKLEKIRAAREPFGYEMPMPATEQQLATLRTKAHALGLTLPPAYVELLEKSDGLEEDGYVVYSSEERHDVSSRDVLHRGFIEENEGWRLDDQEEHFVVFGDGHMDYFIFDMDRQTYHVIDKVSHDICETFISAEALIDYVLDQMIS